RRRRFRFLDALVLLVVRHCLVLVAADFVALFLFGSRRLLGFRSFFRVRLGRRRRELGVRRGDGSDEKARGERGRNCKLLHGLLLKFAKPVSAGRRPAWRPPSPT